MLIHGSFVQSLSLTELQFATNALLRVADGKITDFFQHVPPESINSTVAEKGWQGEEILTLQRGQFIQPGFIDTHTHAPQYPNNGTGGEYELLDWLDNITFPGEAKFKDVDYAKKVYRKVIERTLSLGTTTSCYYGSLHLESTKALADACVELHQRAFVGKCNMDSNCPADYVEPSAEASIADTKALIAHIRTLSTSSSTALVHPIVTPRFAISCSPKLLRGLGDLVREEKANGTEVAIQTHLGENKGEIAFTKELFGYVEKREGEGDWDGTYAGVYDRFGLLSERTILAHCVYLEESELKLLKATNSGISHCPVSNFNLRSGCARIAEVLDRGIKVGLGSDCSGGNEAGILSQIRAATTASKVVGLYLEPEAFSAGTLSKQSHLPLAVTFHMATLGGASLCGLEQMVGNFEVGKEFDALLIDLNGKRGPGVWWDEDVVDATKDWLADGFERFIFTGDDRNISKVWVRGQLVGGSV